MQMMLFGPLQLLNKYLLELTL